MGWVCAGERDRGLYYIGERERTEFSLLFSFSVRVCGCAVGDQSITLAEIFNEPGWFVSVKGGTGVRANYCVEVVLLAALR